MNNQRRKQLDDIAGQLDELDSVASDLEDLRTRIEDACQ